MAGLPQAPKNLFINRNNDYAVVRWDKVVQDVSDPPEYTQVIKYYIYKTSNPALLNWGIPVKEITTDDNYVDKDVFWIDFNAGNYLYKICAENAIGMGTCAISYGIIGNPDEVMITFPCLWDSGLWDVCVFGP